MDDQQKDTNTQVIEDVSAKITSGRNEDKNQAIILMNLEDLIKSNISTIARLKREVAEQRSMLEGGLEGDATYKEYSDRVKEVSKQRAEIRSQIMKQPSMITLVNKVKDLKAEIKERDTSLSDYLVEYQRLANTNQIEVDDEILEIVNVPRLVRLSSKPKK